MSDKPDVLNGNYESVVINRNGVRAVRMKLRTRLRNWALRKLGGTDKSAVKQFVDEFLQPNGMAVHTITRDGTRLVGEFIAVPAGKVGVAVAPWVKDTQIIGCTIQTTTNERRAAFRGKQP